MFDEILDAKKEALLKNSPAKQQGTTNLFPENKDTLDFNNNGAKIEKNPKFITQTFQTPQIFEKVAKKSDLYNPFMPNFTKKTEKSFLQKHLNWTLHPKKKKMNSLNFKREKQMQKLKILCTKAQQPKRKMTLLILTYHLVVFLSIQRR